VHIVVDQNVLRKPALAGYLESSVRNRCVLIDTAFLEMTQSKEWQSTLRASLSQLVPYPERVVAAYSVSQGLARELRTLQSVAGHMLWREATASVREVLTWLQTGKRNATICRMIENPSDIDAKLKNDYFDHSQNKQSIESIVELVRAQLPREFQRALRKPVTSDEDRLEAVHQLATSVAYGVLAERGVARNRARSFLRRRPLFYRLLILKAWNSIDWLHAGGLEGLKPKDATNELLDQHYALTATFFDGVLSEDAKVNRAYTALQALVPREV